MAPAFPFSRTASALFTIPAQPPGTVTELWSSRSPSHHTALTALTAPTALTALTAMEVTEAPGEPHVPTRQRGVLWWDRQRCWQCGTGEAPPRSQEVPALSPWQHHQLSCTAGRGVPVWTEWLREPAGGCCAGGSRAGQFQRGGQEGDCLPAWQSHRHSVLRQRGTVAAAINRGTRALSRGNAPAPRHQGYPSRAPSHPHGGASGTPDWRRPNHHLHRESQAGQ